MQAFVLIEFKKQQQKKVNHMDQLLINVNLRSKGFYIIYIFYKGIASLP